MGGGGSTLIVTHKKAVHENVVIERLREHVDARCSFNIGDIVVEEGSGSRILLHNYCSAQREPEDVARLLFGPPISKEDDDNTDYAIVQQRVVECDSVLGSVAHVDLDFGKLYDSTVEYLNTGNVVSNCLLNEPLLRSARANAGAPPSKRDGHTLAAVQAVLAFAAVVLGMSIVIPSDIKMLETIFVSGNRSGAPPAVSRVPRSA